MRFERITFLLLALGYCTASGSTANAQTATNSTGTGGRHIIQGRVYLPSGQTSDNQVTVELQSTTFTTLTLMSDRNGGFQFRNLHSGNYTIVVKAGDQFEIAREAVTIDPDVIYSSTRTANSPKIVTIPVQLQLKGNLNVKAGILNAKLAQYPKEAVKHFEKGVALHQQNKSEEAIKEYKAALAISPNFALAMIGIGINSLKMNKLETAIEYLNSALKLEPDSFDARLNLGIAYLNNKQLSEAEKNLSEAVKIKDSAVTPHFYLGLVFMQRKDMDKAQSELEIAKTLKPEKELSLVHKYLGGIYWEKKMYREAVVELETYLKLTPNAPDAERIKGTINELRAKII